MALEFFINASQFFREPYIVRIQQRDDFAARMFETKIERRGLPAIRFSQITNRLTEFPQSLLRAIG